MLRLIAYWALNAYFYALMARFVFELVRSINRGWRPRGLLLVLVESLYTITDPPLKALRRIVKPVRAGAIVFDLSWTVLLFIVLWIRARKPRPTGQVSAAFLVGYGALRFIAEYFREPDAHLGLLSAGLSMGQWLCVPMVLAGLGLWVWAGRRGGAPEPGRRAGSR